MRIQQLQTINRYKQKQSETAPLAFHWQHMQHWYTLINIGDIAGWSGWSLGILLARLLRRPAAVPNPRSRTLALDHLDLSIFRMLALSELRQFCSCCFGLFPIESQCFPMHAAIETLEFHWISGVSMNPSQSQSVTTHEHLTPKIYLPKQLRIQGPPERWFAKYHDAKLFLAYSSTMRHREVVILCMFNQAATEAKRLAVQSCSFLHDLFEVGLALW